ncbi:unnamed protein product [Hapterophycus canaliculatus]
MPLATQQLASRATAAVGACLAEPLPTAEGEVEARQQARSAPPILLRDLFGAEQTAEPLSSSRDACTLFHRLDRLQRVADLALEDRVGPHSMSRGCADIGADHGQLAICLLANGIPLVIAGDRAAAPLEVARENARLYLRHAPPQDLPSASLGAPSGSGKPRVRRFTRLPDASEETLERPSDGSGSAGHGNVPRLECRLGDGLAILEEGEVDTVCIAGMGVKTMLQILSASDSSSSGVTGHDRSSELRGVSSLSSLGVRRLVLQPMDARLEYMRDLRVWLRRNGWRIKQETIVSTLGKGGRHAFLTLRADLAESSRCPEQESPPSSEPCSTGWPAGAQQEQERSDWLGDFLPVRTTDPNRMRGNGRNRGRQEALTFLAYLKHQKDWLRAIESARLQASPGQASSSQGTAVSDSVGSVLTAVEAAIRDARDTDSEEWDSDKESLVTARRWRRATDRSRGLS